MDRFRESALNGTAGLSRDTVKDMELLLVHPDNEYVKYLQSNGNGKISSEFGDEIHAIYATVYIYENKLYESVIIDGFPCFLKVENRKDKPTVVKNISIETEVPLSTENNDVIVPLPS